MSLITVKQDLIIREFKIAELSVNMKLAVNCPHAAVVQQTTASAAPNVLVDKTDGLNKNSSVSKPIANKQELPNVYIKVSFYTSYVIFNFKQLIKSND